MNVAMAQKKLEIVKLRNLAEWQKNEYAQSHRQSASMHIDHFDQLDAWRRKAEMAERAAAENDAKADLLEAKLMEEI